MNCNVIKCLEDIKSTLMAGVYIVQNTMIAGGRDVRWGKNQSKGAGENMKKKNEKR